MTAPTTAPRTWTTAEILAEATDAIDIVENDTAETWPILTSLCDAVNDIDHDGLDYTGVRADRFTH